MLKKCVILFGGLANTFIDLVARLRTRIGEEISHACSFTSDEWRQLGLFATFAEELSHTAVVSQKRSPLKISVSAGETGFHFEANGLPDPDNFRACLHLLRPFVLQRENTYFAKMRKILVQRLDHPEFRAYLRRQQAIFDGKRCQAMLLTVNNTVINSPKTLDLWLNAYEYHRDERKRVAFETLHKKETMPVALSRALLIEILLDRVRAVLDVGNAIYAMQRNLVVIPFPGDTPPQDVLSGGAR